MSLTLVSPKEEAGLRPRLAFRYVCVWCMHAAMYMFTRVNAFCARMFHEPTHTRTKHLRSTRCPLVLTNEALDTYNAVFARLLQAKRLSFEACFMLACVKMQGCKHVCMCVRV